MKVLHIIPTLEGGGAERQLTMLAIEQAGRGWDVNIALRRGGVYLDLLCSSQVVVHQLGDYRGPNPRLLLRTNSLIRNLKPDIVQTWLPQMDIIGGVVALWNNVPWILSERTNGYSVHEYKLQAWLRYRIASYANGVVANSSNGAEYWRDQLSTDALVFQVANAVDVEAIRNSAPMPVGLQSSKGSAKEILVVGRLSREKSLESIIQAVRLVPDKHDLHVTIIGEGPLREEIEADIRAAGLNEAISIVPFQREWWGLLKNACALISMSHFEGHPNVVLETIAAGCPLIVSDILAHREFLDEESAILVPHDNPSVLAEAIITVLSDPTSARRRAERASICVADLTIQSAADAYEMVYEKAISGRG